MAALLIHLALFMTVSAHLLDGFEGRSLSFELSTEETHLPELGSVKVLSLNTLRHPDNSLKDTEVLLQFTLDNGQVIEQEIAYNEPALFSGGMREVLIQGGDNYPTGVVLVRQSDQLELRLEQNQAYPLAGGLVMMQQILQSELGMLVTQVVTQTQSGELTRNLLVLDPGAGRHSQLQIAGETYQFQQLIETPIASVQYVYNPSIPLILTGLVLALIGLTLLLAPGGATQPVRHS